MRFQTAIVAAATCAGVSAQAGTPVTGILGDAIAVTNNPPGAVYSATLPATAFTKSAYPDGGNVKGSVYAVSSPDGRGVLFKVAFSGLPKEGGPFLYHIHDQPVPADGNCTATLAHLDPFQRGETPDCDPANPQRCQVGDLSGKNGKVTSDPFAATFSDNYATLTPGLGSFFGNRSFVIHFANKTRISCANFNLVASGTGAVCSGQSTMAIPTVTPTASATAKSNLTTTTSTTASPTSTFVKAAANANAPAAMLALGVAAMAYLL